MRNRYDSCRHALPGPSQWTCRHRLQARQSVSASPDAVVKHAEARRNKFLPVRIVTKQSYEESCRLLAAGLVSPVEKRSRCAPSSGGRRAKKRKPQEPESDESSADDGDEVDEASGIDLPSDFMQF
jgi:hypothetical protein